MKAKLKPLFDQLYKHRRTLSIVVTSLVLVIIIIIQVIPKSDASIPVNMELANDTELQIGNSTGFGLYIDDNFVAALASKEDINLSLSDILEAKKNSLSIKNISAAEFSNSIVITEGEYEEQDFTDKENLLSLLGKDGEYSYNFMVNTVKGEETGIKLSAKVTVLEQTRLAVEFDTTYIDTNSQNNSYKKVLNEGEEGLVIETYSIVYIDDEELSRELVDSDNIMDPVDEVIERGVKVDVPTRVTTSFGILQKPYDGRITSPFGSRNGRLHKGLDIIAKAGQGSCLKDPAYSAADGVVTFAGKKNGYGYCVIIQHSDGISTLYGHLNSISVSANQVVSVGQEIGKIGNTGNSTGPHLHFEVMINNKPVDPLLFLNY